MSTQYFISLLCRCAATPLHYILSIHTRSRRCAPLPLRGNSAMRLSLCAARFTRSAGAAHPVLSTLHLFYDYILFVYAGLFCGLSYTILLLCSLCSIMFYNTVSKHSIFYGLIHSFLYFCINKI